MRGIVAIGTLLVTALLVPVPAMAAQATGCQFVLGFKALHDADAADVGECSDNQASATNGDALQHTTKGLLAWRKADNWTAFTNGYWTWINGPAGLVKRLNTQRFSWEGDSLGMPAASTSAATTGVAPAPLNAADKRYVVTSATALLAGGGAIGALDQQTQIACDDVAMFSNPAWSLRTSELLGVVVASGQALVATPPVSPALAAYQSANVAAGRDVLAAAQAYSAAVQAQSTGQLNATARPMSIAGQELIQAAKQLDALRKQYQVS